MRRRIPNHRKWQQRVDQAVELADRETDIQSPAFDRPVSEGARGYRSLPGGDVSPMAPSVPVPGPESSRQDPRLQGAGWTQDPKLKASVLGVPGTPITSGFLTDLGEYNAELMGRNAIRIYEKMRRGDAQVRATLAACKLPVLSAKWEIVPERNPVPQVKGVKVSSTGQGYATGAKAKEVAEFVKENLFGGLEFRSSTGALISQAWQDVIYNALLMLDFGCAVHEDVWMVDGDRLRLRRLAARHPVTYYRWDVEDDGETLRALIQYGYRKAQFLNVPLPADKMCLFNYQQEAANFWGIALTRAMYPHWYYKSKLYAIDAIANERNSLGVPVFRLAPGFSAEDKATAYNFVTQLASHEATGLVEPPGDQNTGLRIVGYEGRLREVLPSVEHHNVMISRAALALFMDLGQAQHGSRALGKQHGDFFLLALQNVADLIASRMTYSTVRRLVEFNFGEEAPLPRLVAANVQSRGLADMVEMLTQFAQTGLVVSDKPLRDFIRAEGGLPEETQEGLVAIRGETVTEGAAQADVSGRSAGSVAAGESPNQRRPEKKSQTGVPDSELRCLFYSPDEARIPAGEPGGGEWTGSGELYHGTQLEAARSILHEGLHPLRKRIYATPSKNIALAYAARRTEEWGREHGLTREEIERLPVAVVTINHGAGSPFHEAKGAGVYYTAEGYVPAERIARVEIYRFSDALRDGAQPVHSWKQTDRFSQVGEDTAAPVLYATVDPEELLPEGGECASELLLGGARKPPKEIPRGEHDPSARMATTGQDYAESKGFDWYGHIRQEDAIADRVARELKQAKPGLAREAARQVSRLPIEQLQYTALPFPHGLAERVRAILQQAFDYGYGQVWEERKRQTGRTAEGGLLASDEDDRKKAEEIVGAAGALIPEGGKPRAAGGDESPVSDLKSQGPQGDMSQAPPPAASREQGVEDLAKATVSDLVNWLGARAVGAAIEGLKDGLEPPEVEQKIENTILAASDGPIGRTSKEAARQAVFVGRIEAMRDLSDEIEDYERVEAMDDRTCLPCQRGNGSRWKRLEDVTWRAGDDCEGGDACRGRLVVNFRTGMYVIENGKKRWITESK
jgi:phage gp29-like protein